jgi:hypothetical protein
VKVNSEYKDYQYAAVTNKDTIILRNEIGDSININLEQKSWKNIQWSTNKNSIAALGETVPGVFDIYIFNLNEKIWKQATDFSKTKTGVTSYLWQQDNVILFTQGVGIDNWLHRYVNNSGEITKITRVKGVIDTLSSDNTIIMIKSNNGSMNVFEFYLLDGSIIYSTDILKQPSTNIPLQISGIKFTLNPDLILLQSSDNKIYKNSFGSIQITELQNAKNLIPLCGINESVFLMMANNSTSLKIQTINFVSELVKDLATVDLNSANILKTENSTCYKTNNVLINTSQDNVVKWYTIIQNELKENPVLKDVIFLSYK